MKRVSMTTRVTGCLAALALLAAACGGETETPEADSGADEAADAQAEDGAQASGEESDAAEEDTPVEDTAEETEKSDAAASYPEGPITWIVGFDPGGAVDIEARRIQSALEDELGVRIDIDYRPGAGGAVGWSEFADADPDGYTVAGLALPHIAIQPLKPDSPGYETSDLRPLVWESISGGAVLVPEDSPYETLDDLLAAAEDDPGSITLGGVGTYSASDLLFAQLEEQTGADFTYVPIPGGGGPLMTAILGGQVDGGLLGSSHATQNDGLRALAVAGEERYETLPDVPTFEELGYDVTVFYVWGVGMPAGVPDAIADKFAEAVVAAVENSGAAQDMVAEGYRVVLLSGEEAAEFTDEQVESFGELAPALEELHG